MRSVPAVAAHRSVEMIIEIEPRDLGRRLESADGGFVLLDVREPEEHELVAIHPSYLIPLMEIPSRLGEIVDLSESGAKEIIVYCHHGQRSAMATDFLNGQNILNVKNLRGGIHAYAKEVDRELPTY